MTLFGCFHEKFNYQTGSFLDAQSNLKLTRRLPQVLIIGARKCGTRALLKFLEINPAIKSASHEVHFFDRPQNYKLGLDWYRKQMPETYENQVTIEKSPAYFVTPEAPTRVKAMNSSIKLILILRDPVIRLISDFSQLIANKMTSADDLKQSSKEYNEYIDTNYNDYSVIDNETELFWSQAENKFRNYVMREDGGIDSQKRAIKIGMYSMYLERWKSLFSADQFHFVDGEALIKDPYEQLYKLELFLGIEPRIRRDDFVFNPRKGFYCINPKHEFQNYTKLQAIYREKRTIRKDLTSINSSISCLSKSKGRKHVGVDAVLVEKLRAFYAPFNQYLTSLTELNFTWN